MKLVEGHDWLSIVEFKGAGLIAGDRGMNQRIIWKVECYGV